MEPLRLIHWFDPIGLQGLILSLPIDLVDAGDVGAIQRSVIPPSLPLKHQREGIGMEGG